MTTLGMPEMIRAPRLDREAGLLIGAIGPFSGRPISHETVATFRSQWRLAAKVWGRRIPIGGVEDREIAGPNGTLTIRIYSPNGKAKARPAFLWLHGGGFVVGGLASSEAICRGIARASGAVVVALRYRLAPEHSLYAGREDSYAALKWIADNAAEIGVDPNLISVGGDSAGGNIAAALAQESRRRNGPSVCLQVLAYPATDLIADHPSKEENATGYLLSADFVDAVRPLIRGDLTDEELISPWLSPASETDLSSLPPALVITAGFDPIRDDGLDYARRLRDADVPVEIVHYAGQFHGFLNFDSILGAARDAVARIGAAIVASAQGTPANRTIEVYDRRAEPASRLNELPVETVARAMMFGRTVRQVCSVSARSVSPLAATLYSAALSPWWVPMATARRGISAIIDASAASETFSGTPKPSGA